MRRVDSVKHYPEHVDLEPHDDGEIWSGAMYDFYMQSGMSAGDMTKLLLEMQHLLSNTATFAETARALITAEQTLTGGTHAALLRRVMTWHGLLGDIEPRASVGGRERSVTVNLVSGTVPDLADEIIDPTAPA
jgi:hypothetical protein